MNKMEDESLILYRDPLSLRSVLKMGRWAGRVELSSGLLHHQLLPCPGGQGRAVEGL